MFQFFQKFFGRPKTVSEQSQDALSLDLSTNDIRLIVGLGNPGAKYQQTRHNAGFMVLDAFAKRHDLRFDGGLKSEEAVLKDIYFIKPQTYMNLSGQAVKEYAKIFKIQASSILVVQDDLDLPLGRIRFKTGGSAAGQRGVKDIEQYMGSGFHRLKIGIGRPEDDTPISDWVLGRLHNGEKQLMQQVITVSVDAIEVLLQEGMQKAMSLYNGTDLRS